MTREYLGLVLFGETATGLLDAFAAGQPPRRPGAWLDVTRA